MKIGCRCFFTSFTAATATPAATTAAVATFTIRFRRAGRLWRRSLRLLWHQRRCIRQRLDGFWAGCSWLTWLTAALLAWLVLAALTPLAAPPASFLLVLLR